MFLTLLIALGLTGVALALFARAAVFGRIQADENVGRIAAYGYNRSEAVTIAPKRAPMFPKLAAWVGKSFAGGALAKQQEQLRNTLLAAGMWRTSPATVQGYRVILAVTLALLSLWSAASAGWSPFVAVVV